MGAGTNVQDRLVALHHLDVPWRPSDVGRILRTFKIIDYNHAYKLVFEYIEAFYNTVRIHSHCDYASPNDYEKKYWIKLRQMEINVA